jgi:hypothetical protein
MKEFPMPRPSHICKTCSARYSSPDLLKAHERGTGHGQGFAIRKEQGSMIWEDFMPPEEKRNALADAWRSAFGWFGR